MYIKMDTLLFSVLFCGVLSLKLPENENATAAAKEDLIGRDGSQPGVAHQTSCDTVLITGWVVSAVLFLVLLFFCLGIAVQSKRDSHLAKMLEEGRESIRTWNSLPDSVPVPWSKY